MSIRGMFSNINRALGSTTPQQRAQMLAIAGGSSPSPAMGQALYGQSQAIMQALQDEARLKAQAEQADQDRRARMSEGAQDREQRMAELEKTLGARSKEGAADRDVTRQHYGRMEANDARRFSLESRNARVGLLAKQAELKQIEQQYRFAQRVYSDPKATPQQKAMADLIMAGGNPSYAMTGGGIGGIDWANDGQAMPLSGADLVMQEMAAAAAAGRPPTQQPAPAPQQRIYAVPSTPGEYTFPQDQGLLRGLNPPLDARPR